MIKTIRMATWNANGLQERTKDLELLMHTQKLDICLVSETHFTKESHIKLANYNIYHSNHPSNKARGGTAIVIQKSIKHNLELNIETEEMQVTTVTLSLKNKSCKISAIYCPPRYKLKKEDYIQLFKKLGNTFILGGDLNAKHTHWGSRLTTSKGKELYQAGFQLKCEFISSGSPTYWPSDKDKIPDLIDMFIVKGLSRNYMHAVGDETVASDHTPVILTINSSVIIKTAPPSLTNMKTNWHQFREDLQTIQLKVPLKTSYELENDIDLLIDAIQQAAWNNTPPKTEMVSNQTTYSLEVRKLVNEKRKARKKWQCTRAPEDKTILNYLTNKLSNMIQKNKNESVTRYLCNLSAEKDTDYSLWKLTKRLNKPATQNPPIKRKDGTWAVKAKHKASMFAEYLEETFKPLPRQTSEENLARVKNKNKSEIKLVKFKELKNVIKTDLNIKKAPGYDLITGKIIKELPDKVLQKLMHHINAAIRLKYVPTQWKVAEIIMIPKPGKSPNDIKGYRPISLLPIISKIFEKILLKRLKPVIETNNLIPNHQFGFRNNHSTIQQVHRIVEIIEKTLETRKVCSSVFLDVAQAFDRVWHRGLQCKLHQMLPEEWYLILKSYLENRHFRVKVEDEYSELKEIHAGVPQGSVLGPVLYLLYTQDVPQVENTTLATFADDTAVLAVGRNVKEATNYLQHSLDEISKWTRKWRLNLNEIKSVHINFTNQKTTPFAVTVNSQKIPYSNTAKYLGMTLDAKLRWKEHVKKKKEEINIKFRRMQWLMGRNSQLSLHNKILLYKQIIKPIWAYGIQLWGCTRKTNLKIMQTIQNKILRQITNAEWYIRNERIHNDLKISTVQEEVRRHAVRHVEKLKSHENPEMQKVINSTGNFRRLKRTKPMDLAQ